jgi:hypothetical protein
MCENNFCSSHSIFKLLFAVSQVHGFQDCGKVWWCKSKSFRFCKELSVFWPPLKGVLDIWTLITHVPLIRFSKLFLQYLFYIKIKIVLSFGGLIRSRSDSAKRWVCSEPPLKGSLKVLTWITHVPLIRFSNFFGVTSDTCMPREY